MSDSDHSDSDPLFTPDSRDTDLVVPDEYAVPVVASVVYVFQDTIIPRSSLIVVTLGNR